MRLSVSSSEMFFSHKEYSRNLIAVIQSISVCSIIGLKTYFAAGFRGISEVVPNILS